MSNSLANSSVFEGFRVSFHNSNKEMEFPKDEEVPNVPTEARQNVPYQGSHTG
jgi:hypothetical protein